MRTKPSDRMFIPPSIEVDIGDDVAGVNGARPHSVSRPITSFTYPEDDDPSILLGSDDYLGRGGGMLFVSHAGAGKSSWIMDACMSWALGEPWMGIKCSRPLRSLIIQAEDSDRYIGKIFASFAHVRKLTTDQTTQLATNCHIVRVKGISGPTFLAEVKHLAAQHQPDLVIINPLYIYADGDIGRSEFAQPFLMGLDAVNKDEKFAYILVHHTGKPQSKGKDGKRAEVEDWESVYMGFGSSYLANWPRCSALLEPVAGSSGKFLIKLGKGGYNAGVTKITDHEGVKRKEPTTRIPIKHSQEKMLVGDRERPVYYWETDDQPVESTPQGPPRGRPKKFEFSLFSPIFPRERAKAMTRLALYKYAKDMSDISESSFRGLLFDAVQEGSIERIEAPGGFMYYLPVR